MTDKSKRIFWLASYPKSGNTWLRAMYSAYINYGYLDINTLAGSYGDTEGYYLQQVAHKPLTELTFTERLMLRPAQLLHMCEAVPFDPVVVKTHMLNANIDSYWTAPPHVTQGACYIVRDPRDVAVSYADHMGVTIDEAIGNISHFDTSIRNDTTNHIRTRLSSWSENVTSWLGNNGFPVFCLLYEEVHKNPAWALSVFLDKIGYKEIPEERLKWAVTAATFENMRKQEDEKGFKERSSKSKRFFRRGVVGGWRDVLTEEQVARIEEAHGEVMKMVGYELITQKEAA